MASLTRPRHLLATALVFLLTGTTASGLVGVSAGPEDFTVPAPNVGDVGEYTLTHNERDGQRQPGDFIRFAWLDDVRAPDGQGDLMWMNQLRLEHHVAQKYWNNNTLYLEAGTTQRVAHSFGWHEAFTQPSGSLLGGQTNSAHAVDMWIYVDFPASLPCGIINTLQGTTVPVTGTIAKDAISCFNGPHDGEPRNYEIRAAGIGEDNGHRLLKVDVIDTDYDGLLSSMWFREDLPYPVRVETTAGAGAVMELTGFAHGHTALQREARITHLGLTVEEGPWGVGPDLGGFAYHYPVDQAIRDAEEHPEADGLRAFLEEHPTAYIAEARPTIQYSEGRMLTSWSLIWTDGPDALSAAVIQEERWQEIAGQEIPGSRTQNVRFHTYEGTDNTYPVPTALPATAPTAASAVAWFQTYAGIIRPVTEPIGYGWSVRCAWDAQASEYDCNKARVEVSAGVFVHRTDGTWLTSPDIRSNVTELRLADGQASSFIRGDYHSAPAPLATPQEATPAHVASIARWTPPTVEQVAGIAGFSLLVGLAYYLSPLLKSAFPLFTRVRKSELLENPQRQAVHDAIEANPGVHFQELMRITGQANGTVDHHLQKLLHGGLIKAIEGPGYTCYFLQGALDHRVMEAAPALKAEGARNILSAVCAKPGSVPKDIAASVGLSPQTVHYHLHRLTEAGLLAEEREGRTLRLRPTGLAEKAAPLLA